MQDARGYDAPALAAVRERAEALWPVSVDRAPAPGGVRGALLRPFQRAVRRVVRPVVDQQRDLNDAVLKLVDGVEADVRALGDDRRLDEIEQRLLRLERAGLAAPAPATGAPAPAAASTPAAAVPFDYFAFEARMRGSVEEVRARQAVHVDEFRAEGGPVLDVGCGRGEMLALLREAGIEAHGVDANPDMVAFCRGEGLSAETGDAIAHLESLQTSSLGGVFAGQLVEHLQPASLVRLLELAADRLRPGGVLVAETINPLTLTSLTSYFADLTHAQPLVPHTLVFLAQQAGFGSATVRFLNEPPEADRLRRVELPPGPAYAGAQRALDLDVARLNELLFGPLDYALVARR